MITYKANPDKEDIKSVAMALIKKHSCLKERRSSAEWYGWKLSWTWICEKSKSSLNSVKNTFSQIC